MFISLLILTQRKYSENKKPKLKNTLKADVEFLSNNNKDIFLFCSTQRLSPQSEMAYVAGTPQYRCFSRKSPTRLPFQTQAPNSDLPCTLHTAPGVPLHSSSPINSKSPILTISRYPSISFSVFPFLLLYLSTLDSCTFFTILPSLILSTCLNTPKYSPVYPFHQTYFTT